MNFFALYELFVRRFAIRLLRRGSVDLVTIVAVLFFHLRRRIVFGRLRGGILLLFRNTPQSVEKAQRKLGFFYWLYQREPPAMPGGDSLHLSPVFIGIDTNWVSQFSFCRTTALPALPAASPGFLSKGNGSGQQPHSIFDLRTNLCLWVFCR